MNGSIHLLTLSGNVPGPSSSAALLRAFEALVPSNFTVSHYAGLESLPPFNPVFGDEEPAPEVADLREQVAGADALVISTPESPQRLSGAFTNALDWMASSAAVMGKGVAVLSADCGSTVVEEAVNQTLRSMSAAIIPDASAHLEIPSERWDERAIIAQAHLRKAIFRSIDAISDAISSNV